ncbi:MAG: leucine-rich repeat domain-containing protein, partial [Tidjanibacter sp.]|nr:leucine-rich repeat domain-containing protein [Tidjanibacter sp.]
DYVFHGCETVENYNLPESLTTIGTQAISYNTNLKSLTIPKNVTEIGEYAFSMSGYGVSNCELILNCNLSGSYGGHFTTIALNGNITEISNQAFYECYSLTSINIPDSVTKIGDKAFMYCNKLESITIPESVTSIGEYAFASCKNLKEFYCKPTTPPSYGQSMFNYTYVSAIYVPSASVDAYMAAEGWYGQRSKIKGYDF